MILLSIDNSSDVIAQRVGKFLESLTPDHFDEAKVEDVLVRKLMEHLTAEGLHGQIAAVRGLHLQEKHLHFDQQMHVRHHNRF
ncbi:MAG: hypothetical protein ACK41W_10800 [Cyanobacteriota bacterium]|jgi:hypothetical protein